MPCEPGASASSSASSHEGATDSVSELSSSARDGEPSPNHAVTSDIVDTLSLYFAPEADANASILRAD